MTKSAPANNHALRTILFDLDGTLADTAPDLAFALNSVLQEQDCTPLPFETIRPVVSHGGTALIQLGFNIEPGTAAFESLRLRLLDIYRKHLVLHTRLFPGIEELLVAIEQRGMNWGVVTNKPAWLTDPLLEQIGLSERAACVVSGDTVAERKPHPAPMLHACHLAGSEAHQCLYVGDAARDIEAGKRAGMKTLVALFGYIGADEQPDRWGADGMIAHPAELLDWITAHD